LQRIDQRKNYELRPTKIITDFISYAPGSVLIEVGKTRVICTATLDEKVPPFLKGTGKGWLTSEYSMLPASTQVRKARESSRGKLEGRTQEIQRLIGRSLRSVINLDLIGERTIWIDCDVIQADGGTRTASITGGFVALALCIKHMIANGIIGQNPITDYVAAVSMGIYNDEILLDLCYEEDSQAMVDMNLVMTGSGKIVEIQGTAEGNPFNIDKLFSLIELGQAGIHQLIQLQKKAIGDIVPLYRREPNE